MPKIAEEGLLATINTGPGVGVAIIWGSDDERGLSCFLPISTQIYFTVSYLLIPGWIVGV